jgi:phosphatidylserine/phosphatidylglycerophosphate/cardiolipin synthase-like enzyme
MLSDILRLADRDLEQLLEAISQRVVFPGAGVDQIRKAGLCANARRIEVWLNEAMEQFGSVERLSALIRLVREQRSQLAAAHPAPELILTGPEVEDIATRDTRVVVREMFEAARRSVLLVGFAFYRSDEIFEPLASRIAGNANLKVRIVVNVHPKRGRPAVAIIDEFAAEFFRSIWPFHPLPEVYYDPNSLKNPRSGLASVHAKLVVVDRRWVYLGSANFTRAAFHRNLEAGIRVRDGRLGEVLVTYFDRLIQDGHLRRLGAR